MLFNSFVFVLFFLPATLIVYFWLGRIGHRSALVWLFVASLAFYAWWNPVFLGLLLGSLVLNYALGYSLAPSRGMERRWLLIGGVAANLLLLGYFKYAAFALGIAGFRLDPEAVVLPLAISFFTFTQIGFLVDCHRGRIVDFDPLHYGLFVVYFPHLIAGPIIHHGDVAGQFADARASRVRWDDMASGVTLFLLGLFKKVVIADQLATPVNRAYVAVDQGVHLTALESGATAVGFLLQIYFDFSAYCDMALGVSVMLGVRLPLNFNSPLKATSILDFWRRWNITLTRFLSAYIYQPMARHLARQRAASARSTRPGGLLRRRWSLGMLIVLPAMTTMVASGIWHGAGWTFVIFGALHGTFVVVNQMWRKIVPPLGLPRWLGSGAGLLLTFAAVAVSVVFFRAPTLSVAWSILEGLAGVNGFYPPAELPEGRRFHVDAAAATWIAIGLAIVWLLPNPYQWMAASRLHLGDPVEPWRFPATLASRLTWRPTNAWTVLVALLGATAMIMMGSHVTQFIYFQF